MSEKTCSLFFQSHYSRSHSVSVISVEKDVGASTCHLPCVTTCTSARSNRVLHISFRENKGLQRSFPRKLWSDNRLHPTIHSAKCDTCIECKLQRGCSWYCGIEVSTNGPKDYSWWVFFCITNSCWSSWYSYCANWSYILQLFCSFKVS